MEFILKSLVAGVIIATIGWVSQKNITLAAIIMGIPTTAFIAMVFMHYQGISDVQMSTWALETIKYVLTSLLFFVIFSYTVIHLGFWYSMFIGLVITVIMFNIVMKVT